MLRNNDLGDVLLSTPLLSGLKQNFKDSEIFIGVGDWAVSLLKNNSDINGIIKCNAPWHNKQNCNYPANSYKTFLHGLFYVLLSNESRRIKSHYFTHGIDVLGSRQGSWLMKRARIPNRFGVKGYAGGENWCHKHIKFDANRGVAESSLAFLNLLDKRSKIEPRPILNLDVQEIEAAQKRWGKRENSIKRLIIAPGAGFEEKCWGNNNFTKLTELLLKSNSYQIAIIGSKEDKERIKIKKNSKICNYCGTVSLRESAALISVSDFTITNSSLSMHLAGAFKVPSLTLLGNCYNSAIQHHKQWGYPEGLVLGKENNSDTNRITTVNEAYKKIIKLLNT